MVTFLKTRGSKLGCCVVSLLPVLLICAWSLIYLNAILRPDLVFSADTSRSEKQIYREIYDVNAMMLEVSKLRIESKVLREKKRGIWRVCESLAAVESSPRLRQRFMLLQFRWGSPPSGVDYSEGALKNLNECIGIDPDSLEGLLAKFFILEHFSHRHGVAVGIRLDFDSLSARLEDHKWDDEPFLPIATGFRMKSEFLEWLLWNRTVIDIMQSQGLSFDDALLKTSPRYHRATVQLFKPLPVMEFLVWVRLGFPSESVDRSEL